MAKAAVQHEEKPKRETAGWTVGRCYLIFTPTNYYTGRLAIATPTELVFEDCSWIPDTGRLNECLRTGVVRECEPLTEELILPRYECKGTGWEHPLPRTVK